MVSQAVNYLPMNIVIHRRNPIQVKPELLHAPIQSSIWWALLIYFHPIICSIWEGVEGPHHTGLKKDTLRPLHSYVSTPRSLLTLSAQSGDCIYCPLPTSFPCLSSKQSPNLTKPSASSGTRQHSLKTLSMRLAPSHTRYTALLYMPSSSHKN